MNRAPDFGRLGDNLYDLQGFSGHGVALTVLAGRLVAEAVPAARIRAASNIARAAGALIASCLTAFGSQHHFEATHHDRCG